MTTEHFQVHLLALASVHPLSLRIAMVSANYATPPVVPVKALLLQIVLHANKERFFSLQDSAYVTQLPPTLYQSLALAYLVTILVKHVQALLPPTASLANQHKCTPRQRTPAAAQMVSSSSHTPVCAQHALLPVESAQTPNPPTAQPATQLLHSTWPTNASVRSQQSSITSPSLANPATRLASTALLLPTPMPAPSADLTWIFSAMEAASAGQEQPGIVFLLNVSLLVGAIHLARTAGSLVS